MDTTFKDIDFNPPCTVYKFLGNDFSITSYKFREKLNYPLGVQARPHGFFQKVKDYHNSTKRLFNFFFKSD